MPGFSWRLRALVSGILILGAAFLAGAYLLSNRRLAAAREARRDDDCSGAERSLAACWRLPGLRRAIELEEQLLGVQQGDLRNEKEWETRVAGKSTRYSIREKIGGTRESTFLIRRKRNGFVPDPRLTFSRARCRLVSPLRRQPHPSCQPQACRPHLKSVLMYWTGAI